MTKLGRPELDSLMDGRYARVMADYWWREPRLTFLVASHEYLVPEQQQNLYMQLERILDRFPNAPVFVEGFEGPRKVSRWGLFGSTISNRERRESQALSKLGTKGNLASDVLAELHPGRTTVVGVDAAATLREQREKAGEIDRMIKSSYPRGAVAMPTRDLIEGSFGAFFDLIVDALEDKALNPKLKKLVETRRGFHQDFRVTRYAVALADLARPEGVDLEAYASVNALVSGLEMERSLDFQVVENERQGLIQKLVDYSVRTLSTDRARAVEEWLEASPAPASAAGAAARYQLGDVPRWMERLIQLSVAYSERKMNMTEYFTRLKGLTDALGIETDERSPLAKYTRYVMTADRLDTNQLMTVEFPGLYAELADIFTTTAAERGILELREKLSAFNRFFTAALPAPKVRAFLGENASFAEWLEDALRIGDAALASGWIEPRVRSTAKNVGAILEKARPLFNDYYAIACRRSEQMAARAARADGASDGVAVWVCGRFHLHEAQQVLRRAGNVSWAILVPQSSRKEPTSQIQTWNWVYPDSEWAMAETFPSQGSAA